MSFFGDLWGSSGAWPPDPAQPDPAPKRVPYGSGPVSGRGPSPVPDSENPNHPDQRVKLTDMSVGHLGKPAAHETGGVMRMHRAGFSALQIQRTLGVFPGYVVSEIRMAIEREQQAHAEGRDIWDAQLPKGTK